ncbi:MAG: ribonuclease HII [Fretibacterium sp.]|nr:ribonuclease HII [Fretibacterium sp.]
MSPEAAERLSSLAASGPLVGTDEAGRGPLAGPVMGAAVLLTPAQEEALTALGLDDSKKLSPASRERLFAAMEGLGVLWRAQAAGIERIARDNVLQASLWAMGRSVLKLRVVPVCVVTDGPFAVPDIPFEQWPMVGADRLVPVVAAASIVAKVLRDRVMTALDALYPQYGFARHKGYPTVRHREALERCGPCPIHRRR